MAVDPSAGAWVSRMTKRSATTKRAIRTIAGSTKPNPMTSTLFASSRLPMNGRPGVPRRKNAMTSRATAPRKTMPATTSIHHHRVAMSWAGLEWGFRVDWLPPHPASCTANSSAPAKTKGRRLERHRPLVSALGSNFASSGRSPERDPGGCRAGTPHENARNCARGGLTHAWPGHPSNMLDALGKWPLVRQLRDGDPLGLGKAAQSERSKNLRPRIDDADTVGRSICPYCAVGCGQLVYVKDGDITHIEGDPASPISRGRLCPKGQASKSFVQSPLREYKVKYRRPYGNSWEELDLETAMDMIAQRIVETRAANWQETTDEGEPANRTLAIGNLGGATLDNEENYLIKKLMTALGVIQVENQARI